MNGKWSEEVEEEEEENKNVYQLCINYIRSMDGKGKIIRFQVNIGSICRYAPEKREIDFILKINI